MFVIKNFEKKRNTVEFVVYGDRALFSDPITRVGGEKSTYYVPTYEALKGIISSVYWKPTIVWVIDAVRVMNEIETAHENILNKSYNGGKDLSIYTYLTNVRYKVMAHFEWNLNRPEFENDRNENKHHNIAKRMIERGGRRDVFLGTRECQAVVEPTVFSEEKGFYDRDENKKPHELYLGYMFHGFSYADEATRDNQKGKLSSRFHEVTMKNGYIYFPHPDEISDENIRILHDAQIKEFTKGKNFSGLDEFSDIFGKEE